MYGTQSGATDEEIYNTWSSRVFPGDWPHLRFAMADCQRTGVLEIEYRYQHPERGLRHHHSKGRRMVGSSRFFGVVGDITNRKRAEEALSRREEEFRSLADAMPQLVWMADRDGSHLRQLTELRGSVAGFPRWSPDGKKIAFHSRLQSYARLYVLDLSSGRGAPALRGG